MGRKPWPILLRTPSSVSCCVSTMGVSRRKSVALHFARASNSSRPSLARSMCRRSPTSSNSRPECCRRVASRPPISASSRLMRRSTATGAMRSRRASTASSLRRLRPASAQSSPTRTSVLRSRRRCSPSRSCARSTLPRSATTCRRRDLQRVLDAPPDAPSDVDGRRPQPAAAGGRPAALFRFASHRLEVTDEFAALRPPR